MRLLVSNEKGNYLEYGRLRLQKLREIKKPVHDLEMDIVKYPEFLAIRLYEDNFMQYIGTKKEMVIDYVDKVKKMLETYGVRVELEGVPSSKPMINFNGDIK